MIVKNLGCATEYRGLDYSRNKLQLYDSSGTDVYSSVFIHIYLSERTFTFSTPIATLNPFKSKEYHYLRAGHVGIDVDVDAWKLSELLDIREMQMNIRV